MFPTNEQYYADVILPLNVQNTYTYAVPEELLQAMEVGKRVVVQFGAKRFYAALVFNLHDTVPDYSQIKPILSVLDDKPLVNQHQIAFWQWIADYYMCTMGEVYKAALPSGLKLESETKIFLNHDCEFEPNSAEEQIIIDILVRKKSLTIQEASNLLQKKNVLPLVKRMAESKTILLTESLKRKFKPKTETIYRVAGSITDEFFVNKTFEKLSKAPKQSQLFLFFVQYFGSHSEEKHIHKSKLLALSETSPQTIKTLVEKGILISEELEVGRLDTASTSCSQKKELNAHQQEAYDAIQKAFAEKDTVLLHGVTSSGKTEIYTHLIQDALDAGKQILYLLPEIALTTQIISRLKQIFGNSIGIYHSRFSDAERVEVWNNIVNHEKPESYKILLGARSSVFLPFHNLGLIIVDEEHETSFKQFDPAPRYHARDAAIILARQHGAKLLLGTATPSIETFANAKHGKYGLVSLTKRHKEIALPHICIVDTKEARKKRLMRSHFSKILLDKIETRLQNKEQVILFQNRRGFSPFLECNVCGNIPKCKYCDVSLTYHKSTNTLVCHYCGFHQHNQGKCPACGGTESETRGFGTEKVEDEIALFFPEAKILRMDLDTTRTKDAYERIITEFASGTVDILIGTQMVTKGLDFENVSLVGILNADTMLNSPDFRAFERSFQMTTQVSGRAGRSKKRGEVVIQTTAPDHVVLRDIMENDFFHHFQSQMNERHQFRYPPFTRLIRLTIKHRNKEMLDYGAGIFANQLRAIFGNRVLGPEYPLIGKIQNLYLKTIIIKIERGKSAQKAKQHIQKTIDATLQMENLKGLQFIPDVDPY